MAVLCTMLVMLAGRVQAADSACYGTPAAGRLERGVRLPPDGSNFRAYSRDGVMLGRTHAHSRVVDAIADAYGQLRRAMPGKIYVYGESGFVSGGRFEPHKTHRNGLSVDFMVPVLDRRGRSVPLPGNAKNRYGYDLEFDASGRLGELRIDFEALAEHLHALDRAGRRRGAPIGRVILAPEYLPTLFATARGPALRGQLRFERGRVWWRHDEHYHVDFLVPCRPMA